MSFEGEVIANYEQSRLTSDKAEYSNSKGFLVISNNVIIKTPTETATGNKGSYETKTGLVNIYGSVVITRGADKVYGEYGQVNLNTGRSKILGSSKKGGNGKKRVRAIFTLEKDKED